MNQTAVEWLVQELNLEGWDYTVEQALVMEKQQIVNAVDGFPISKRHLNGEEYYNETYNKTNI